MCILGVNSWFILCVNFGFGFSAKWIASNKIVYNIHGLILVVFFVDYLHTLVIEQLEYSHRKLLE